MTEDRPTQRSDADPNAMPLSAAIAHIVARLDPVSGDEPVPLYEALGRIAACDIIAELDVPPFRASAMDGYAFRHADAANSKTPLSLTGRSLAGHPGPDHIAPGCCQRITTGARVPDEADTVVQQEDVTLIAGEVSDQSHQVVINTLPDKGEHVRAAGSDTPTGTRLITTGHALRGADAAVCAAHGIATINVFRKIRIGMLSTGDELVEPDGVLGRGKIHDANRVLLHALLQRASVELIDLGIVADTPEALLACINSAPELDVLVSSGGVSVGDADHVKDVLGADGEVELWKIAMKPGRPLAFGHLKTGQAWFGLPGNPVSAAITALMILEPAIAQLTSQTYRSPPTHTALLTTTIAKRPGRIEFQRGVLDALPNGEWSVRSVGAQDSHRLQSLQSADCLIELPVESQGAAKGDRVTVVRLADCGQGQL